MLTISNNLILLTDDFVFFDNKLLWICFLGINHLPRCVIQVLISCVWEPRLLLKRAPEMETCQIIKNWTFPYKKTIIRFFSIVDQYIDYFLNDKNADEKKCRCTNLKHFVFNVLIKVEDIGYINLNLHKKIDENNVFECLFISIFINEINNNIGFEFRADWQQHKHICI